MIEGAEAEVEHLKEQPQEEEYVGADQEQEPEPEQELINFYNTQGKHRFMLNPVSFTIESYNYYCTYASKFIGVV